jgi:hypothetical protein
MHFSQKAEKTWSKDGLNQGHAASATQEEHKAGACAAS